MIKDILNLLKFKPEPIEYYQKYSQKTSIGIAIFISAVYSFLLPQPPEIKIFAHFLMTLTMVPLMLIVTWTLIKLLKFKLKNPSFQALFTLAVLASIIDLLLIPLVFLTQFHGVFDYLQLIILCYSFLVFFFAFAKANAVNFSFSLLAMLLGMVTLTVLMMTTSIIFTSLGLMPMPTLPPV
ncbi:hypothetical protein [Bathymodiolus septemdierum thioautotrophic gill symbiont]|uniref:Yip1 domain-containing protein n=1 Tax=endosymbiont of Bathymodiolus septemdierum str. Myojin knoll TaxID=1303921 RepID=A0A0P0UTU8_9GAMM|nr:hypothetical protein [Bathymodiolus septemdierum thioautotrophic gill symbiont]BAS68394.1 hypothetical protein BSEPE_1415 [endosymbiont of Bathymodiolus septemdierum str. Myojin knoll]